MTARFVLQALALGAIALSVSTPQSVGAQVRDRTCTDADFYRGRCVDVPLVRTIPGEFRECDRVRGRSQAEVYACFLAVSEARNMAVHYAGGNGRMLGFHRGFAAGMRDAERTSVADRASYELGRRSVDRMGNFMQAGIRSAGDRGAGDGSREGAELAQRLFERAVVSGGSGQLPPRAIDGVAAPNYQGEDNGYARFVPQTGEFANLRPEEILRRMEGESAFSRYNAAYAHIDRTTAIYMGAYSRPSFRELWFDNGVYEFDARRWLDPQVALRVWLTQPRMPRAQYDTLNRNAPDDIERHPNTGDPVTGPDGKSVCRRPLVDSRTGAVTGCAKIDLQGVFQRSFVDAYAHYVGHSYSTMLYAGLDDGYRNGTVVGAELGRREARIRGMIEGFDETFRMRTRDAFAAAYERAYRSGFDAEFERHRTHAILTVDILDVIGEVADGILQPAERFSIRYRVTNSGGVAAPFSGAVSGTVDGTTAFSAEIGSLTSREFTTGIVGRVDPGLRAGERADIRLAVNGVLAQTISPVVRRALQLSSNTAAIDAPAGTAAVSVRVVNVSSVRTPGDAVVILSHDGRDESRSVGALDPGQSAAVTFDLSGQDPLRLMFGGAEAAVRVRMGEVIADEAAVRLLSRSPREDIVRYFTHLARGAAAGAFVPEATSRDRRLDEVVARIVSINEDETSGARANPWKDAPGTTVVGIVRDEARSLPADDPGVARFRELGDRMWIARSNLGRFLFFNSGKRKAYERIVQDIRSGP